MIMTQEEKAQKYDELVRQGDVIQAKLSRLQSQNAGINTTSDEYERQLAQYRSQLANLENQMARLFM